MLFNRFDRIRYSICLCWVRFHIEAYIFIFCFFSSIFSMLPRPTLSAVQGSPSAQTEDEAKKLRGLLQEQTKAMDQTFEIANNYVENERGCYLLWKLNPQADPVFEKQLINGQLQECLNFVFQGARFKHEAQRLLIEKESLLQPLLSLATYNAQQPCQDFIPPLLIGYLNSIGSIIDKCTVHQKPRLTDRSRKQAPCTEAPKEVIPSFTESQVFKLALKLTTLYPRAEHIGCIEFYPPDKDGRTPPLGGMHAVVPITIPVKTRRPASIKQIAGRGFLCPEFVKNPSSAKITPLYEMPADGNSPFKLECVQIEFNNLRKISSCFIINDDQKDLFWATVHDCIGACLSCPSMRDLAGINEIIQETGQRVVPARLVSESIAVVNTQQPHRAYELKQRYICSCFDNLAVCLVFIINLEEFERTKEARVTSVKLQTLFPLLSKYTITLASSCDKSSCTKNFAIETSGPSPLNLKSVVEGVIQSLANYIYKSLGDSAKSCTTNYFLPDPAVINSIFWRMIKDFRINGFPGLIEIFKESYKTKLEKLQTWFPHNISIADGSPHIASLPNGDGTIVYLDTIVSSDKSKEDELLLTVIYLNDQGYFDIVIPIKGANKFLQDIVGYEVERRAVAQRANFTSKEMNPAEVAEVPDKTAAIIDLYSKLEQQITTKQLSKK